MELTVIWNPFPARNLFYLSQLRHPHTLLHVRSLPIFSPWPRILRWPVQKCFHITLLVFLSHSHLGVMRPVSLLDPNEKCRPGENVSIQDWERCPSSMFIFEKFSDPPLGPVFFTGSIRENCPPLPIIFERFSDPPLLGLVSPSVLWSSGPSWPSSATAWASKMIKQMPTNGWLYDWCNVLYIKVVLLAPTGALIVIDAIDVTSVTLSRLNSINEIDVTRYLGHI